MIPVNLYGYLSLATSIEEFEISKKIKLKNK